MPVELVDLQGGQLFFVYYYFEALVGLCLVAVIHSLDVNNQTLALSPPRIELYGFQRCPTFQLETVIGKEILYRVRIRVDFHPTLNAVTAADPANYKHVGRHQTMIR
jgi:hypothetical protein